MLRCIRNSVDAGHITLEDGQAVQRKIDQVIRAGIGPAEARARVAAELEAEAFERKRRALLTETRRQAVEADVLAHRNAAGAHDPAEALIWLHEHHGQARFEDIETRRLAILGGAHAKLDALLTEFRKGAIAGDLRRKRGQPRARLEAVVAELFGEDSGDKAAKELAQAWTDTAEDLRQRFNAAGGAIGKLEKWGLPQHHDAEALLRAGRETWVRHITPLLDAERMRHNLTGERLTPDELREALETIWERITTDGWIDREPTGATFGKGALFRQRADHRFLHFKDARSWLAYQRDFGEGDPFAAMMGHLSIMSRDIAAMEILGPNPNAMREYLKQLVTATAARVRPTEAIRAEQVAQLQAIGARLTRPDPRFAELSQRIGAVHGELDTIRQRYRPQLGGAPSKRDRARIEALQAELATLERDIAPYRAGDKPIVAEDAAAAQELQTLLGAMREEIPFAPVAEPLDAARKAIYRADAMWDVMRGSYNAPVNSRVANGLAATRSFISAASLGSATLSAVSDVAFGRIARSFVGLRAGVGRVVGDVVRQLGRDSRREAVRAGLMLDSALHVMHSQARYVGSVDTRSIAGYVADRVLGLSGLSAWTQAGKHAFGMAFQAELADRVGLAFADLPDALRNTLDRHGIAAADWEQIRQARLYEPEPGAVFLRPSEIEQDAGRALAEKYLAMILRETRFAVPEGTVRSSAMMTTGRPGTFVGELTRNFWQFKSFGVAVVMLHGGRVAREVGAGRGAKGAAYAGSLLITGTLLGALALQLKELANGRDPRDMASEGFWGAALLQGGGLGIYGDFLFSGVNRSGGGLTSTVAGPLVGLFDQLRNRTVGNALEAAEGSRTNIGREAVQTLRDWTPGGSLWYVRAAYERMVLDQLQYLADPEAKAAFRRRMQSRKRDFGNGFWWRPGDAAPARGPDLGGVIGR